MNCRNVSSRNTEQCSEVSSLMILYIYNSDNQHGRLASCFLYCSSILSEYLSSAYLWLSSDKGMPPETSIDKTY